MEPQPVVMDSAAGGSPKGKKRRKFWRLRRQKETDRDHNNEDTRSASDGRISPQDEEDVAELLANPWLVSKQWDRLSPAVQEEDEETSTKSTGYKVTVTILSGHGLAVRDRTGTSDPYVKMRYGLTKYKTAVISRCLNPVWNEVHSFDAHDLSIPLQLRVYDHDFASSDDFMGEGSLDLNSYNSDIVHTVELGLTDGNSPGDLGFIRLLVELRDLLDVELEEEEVDSVDLGKVKRSGSQQWLSTVTITLLGAKSLPSMDDNGLSDPYCKFKLGNQKYKSKVQPKTLDPEWKERFEMKLYDSGSTSLHLEVWDRDFPASDDYIGCCEVELKGFELDRTHEMCLPLEDNTGSVQLLLAITGTESQCVVSAGSTTWSDTANKYGLMRSYRMLSLKDLGALQVKVCKAESLASSKGHINPYVMVEVENAQVRTRTLYRETNPIWDKTFLFNVRDIHSTITVSVYSEGKSKDELIGKLIIPLLRVVSGAVKRYALKDKTCVSRSVGTIMLNCDIVYNPFKAAIRTVNPRETHVLEADQKLKRKLLLQNIRRCTDVVRTVMAWWQFIQSLWSWQNKPRSTFAFIVFMLVCIFADLWMFCVGGIIMFVVSYFVWGKTHSNSYHSSAGTLASRDSLDSIENVSDFSDMEEVIEDSSTNKEEKQSLRKRWRQLQDVLLTLQWATGYVADLSERLKNFFCWSVPFLCWMAVVGLTVAAVVLYFIPLRYIVLLWGINKFTKRLRNPHHIPNQEILDFLSRAPTDIEQLQWKELHIKSSANIKKLNGRSGKKR